MAFENSIGYKKAFEVLKPVLISFIIGMSALCAFIYFYSVNIIEKAKNNIIAIDPYGNIFTVQAREYTLYDQEVEYRAATKDFIYYWFDLNKDSYDKKIKAGLKQLGKGKDNLYGNYTSIHLLNYLTVNNIILTVEEIQIKVNMKSKPATCQFKIIQSATGGSGAKTRREIVSNEFYFSNVFRSEENPHGILLEDLQIQNLELKE